VTIKGAAVGSAAPFHFQLFHFGHFMAALRKRNNVTPAGLMSDQAHASTIGQIKNQSQKQFAKVVRKK
jgi:hypothetical protein